MEFLIGFSPRTSVERNFLICALQVEHDPLVKERNIVMPSINVVGPKYFQNVISLDHLLNLEVELQLLRLDC